MRDCPNVKMRELLPDLLHDRLPASVRADLEAHLQGCGDCRAELMILRQVVAAAVAPRVDASRIAAALPPYRARPMWRRATSSPQFRIAAAVVLLAGAATAITTMVNRPDEPRSTVVQDPATPTPAPTGTTGPATTPSAVDAAPGIASASRDRAPTELAVGETLHDLSDSELRALLDELGALEAVTPSDPEIVVPSLGRSGT